MSPPRKLRQIIPVLHIHVHVGSVGRVRSCCATRQQAAGSLSAWRVLRSRVMMIPGVSCRALQPTEDAPLINHNGDRDVECHVDGWELLQKLPPQPAPTRRQAQETRVGLLCSVLALVSILLPLHLATPGDYPPPMTTSPPWICMLWSEGIAIIACILGIVCADPGTIPRTPETCLPLPVAVADRLRDGRTLDGVANVEQPDGHVFCVRCLVWRPPPCVARTHHCAVCQRCTVGFDHHCVVFGRCIAGDGCHSGNLRFFRGLLLLTALGIVTCVVSPKGA